MSYIVQLLIAASPLAPMENRTEVRVVPGRGIEGDRYFEGTGTFSPHPQKPDFEITFVEQEKIDGFERAAGFPFTAAQARRNVVTKGVDLNALVGQEFVVGKVRIRGLRLCEPCNYLAKLTRAEVLKGLIHQGGLRAQILSEGFIRTGDRLSIADVVRG